VTCARVVLQKRLHGETNARSVPQAPDQMTLKCNSPLDMEGLVNRLSTDPHGLISGIVDKASIDSG
jgi:hypothetical protein